MLPIDGKIGETNILLYNFNEQTHQFTIDIFDAYAINFNDNTFYIKKVVKAQSLDLGGTWEYFRTGNNQWKEVSMGPTGFTMRELMVTEEIVLRDTSLQFNPETYEDLIHIIDYRKVK
jgi:hypothetical protein